MALSRDLGGANGMLRIGHGNETPAAKWWFRVGNRTFHTDKDNKVGSASTASYYYAYGPRSSLTEELQAHHVGTVDEALHVFLLPNGSASFMQHLREQKRDRRSTLSALIQLERGSTLRGPAQDYPEYSVSFSYRNPLTEDRQAQAARAVGQISEQDYKGFLTRLVDIGDLWKDTRYYANSRATKAAVKHLTKEFKAMGLTTCVQSFKAVAQHKTSNMYNVMAFVRGLTPGSVTVGAHFDSIPMSGAAPGAVDNGSGVASVLSQAKALSSSGTRPIKSMYFVAFGAEEVGLYGSKAFVKELLSGQKDNIPEECRLGSDLARGEHSSIIMDMIGWRSPRFRMSTITLESHHWVADVVDHLASSNLDHNSPPLRTLVNWAPYDSDHESFLNAGLKSALTINGDDGAYPCYHKSCDTEEKVDPKFGMQTSVMNLGAALRMAGIRTSG